ncbi:MAG: VanZ family protein [bacterium]|nr:VanZ family protein [bacterium]
MKRFLFNWGPVLLLAFAIYLNTAIPHEISLPSLWDKVVHFLVFLLLGFLTTRALLLSGDYQRSTGVFLGSLLVMAWGILDEFHQSFVPGRHASWGDGVANGLGAIAGALLFTYLGVLLYKSHKLYPPKPNACRPG